jgi:hypothetical protein
MKCAHCRKRPLWRRVLCQPCYKRKPIRALYPTASQKYSPAGYEPTEAELVATIAEQSRPENLPKWWANAAANQD